MRTSCSQHMSVPLRDGAWRAEESQTSDRGARGTRFAGKKANAGRDMQSRLGALQTSTTRHPVQHCPAQMRVGCGELEKRESGTCARNARASRHAFRTRTGGREQGWDQRRREAERRASWRVCAATEAGVGRYLIRLDMMWQRCCPSAKPHNLCDATAELRE